jgi:hypothetical protein
MLNIYKKVNLVCDAFKKIVSYTKKLGHVVSFTCPGSVLLRTVIKPFRVK